ncbi:unnamed protein product [Closterium sp. NIES-64]|nr:unnamed protein product [Closterium sp. NIES-64]
MTHFPRDGEGWNLIKIHGLSHLPEAIRRGGHPREYSAATFENAHISACKRPYRGSNKRDFESAILQGSSTRSALQRLPDAFPHEARVYNTAAKRARTSGRPALTSSAAVMRVAAAPAPQAGSVFEEYNTATGGKLRGFQVVMRSHGYCSAETMVRTRERVCMGEGGGVGNSGRRVRVVEWGSEVEG